MANLSNFEEQYRANYHNLNDFSRLVAFPTLAPQVVPNGGDQIDFVAPPVANDQQAVDAAIGGLVLFSVESTCLTFHSGARPAEQDAAPVANVAAGQVPCIVRGA